MGKPDITTVIGYLTEKQIRADRGYPSTPMPQIRALAVAVNMYRMEPDAARMIGLAVRGPGGQMAPAARTLYRHILETYRNI